MKLNYYKYLFNKTSKLMFTLFGIISIITLLIIIAQGPTTKYSTGVESYTAINLCLSLLTVILITACIIVPIQIKNQFLTKQKCDTLYSLPIKRTTMLLQSSIYGFVSSIALWSVLLLLVTITYLFKGINLNIQYIFLYYFIMIISGGLMFTFCTMLCSFVTNKSNCYYAIILGLFCINMIFNLLPSSYYDVYGPFSSLSYFTAYCGSHAIDYPVGYDIRYTNLGNSFVSFILLFILAIPSVFFTIKIQKNLKHIMLMKLVNQLYLKYYYLYQH